MQLLEAVLKDGAWVPLECYCDNYNETRDAVYSRRAKGIWQDGVHCKFVKGGGLWINLIAVNTWAAKSELRRASPSGSTEAANQSGSA
jgi:hypothetical protein